MLGYLRIYALLLALLTGEAALAANVKVKFGKGFNIADNQELSDARKHVLLAAAKTIEGSLRIKNDITIYAEFVDNLPCTAHSAVLGRGSANNLVLLDKIWYVQALAKQLDGYNYDAKYERDIDLQMAINARLDGNPNCMMGTKWSYGIDFKETNHATSLYATVLHEILHGLGFASHIGADGQPPGRRGTQILPNLDVFSLNLNYQGKGLDAFSAAERKAMRSVSPDADLYWHGSKAMANSSILSKGVLDKQVQMDNLTFSHFAMALYPDQLLEPMVNGPIKGLSMEKYVLADIGWQLQQEQPSAAKLQFAKIADLTMGRDSVREVALDINKREDMREHISVQVYPAAALEAELIYKNGAHSLRLKHRGAATQATVELTLDVADTHIEQSFAVQIVAPIALQLGKQPLASHGVSIVANTDLPIVSNAAQPAVYQLRYNGEVRPDLLAAGKLLRAPTGSYAGLYELQITGADGLEQSFSFVRMPRITSVAPTLLATAAWTQYLQVEGLPANTSVELYNPDAKLQFVDQPKLSSDSPATFNNTLLGVKLAAGASGSTEVYFDYQGQSLKSEIAILELKTVRIDVRDANGKPIAAQLHLPAELDKYQLPAAKLDAAGQLTQQLPQSAVRLSVSAPAYQLQEFELPAAAQTWQLKLRAAEPEATTVPAAADGGGGGGAMLWAACLCCWRRRR